MKLSRARNSASITLAGLALAAWGAAARPPSPARELVSPEDVADCMHRAGLDPQALAIVGVPPARVGAVVRAVEEQLALSLGEIRAAERSLSETIASHDALERLVQSGKADEADRGRVQSLRAQASADRARLQLAVDAIVAAAGLSEAQHQLIARLAVRKDLGVPAVYRVSNRAEPDTIALREALANVRIAASLGEQPDPECHSLVLDANADPAIALARVNLDSTLALVEAEWWAAVRQ